MIKIRDLVFRYPRSDFQLRIDKLNIETGSKIAIVGPSGSGKTTLLNLMAGIAVPDSGVIEIAETNIEKLSDSDRRNFRIKNIGLVFQQFELVEYLRVTDNILLPYLINSSLAKSANAAGRASDLASGMGLGDKLKRYPRQLSQGEQQRVAICRALIEHPKIILADEPTGNLDPTNKTKILKLLFQSASENGQTLVVVTHDMNILDGFDDVIDFEMFRQALEV